MSKTSRSILKLRGYCGWCPSTPTQPRSELDFVNGLEKRAVELELNAVLDRTSRTADEVSS